MQQNFPSPFISDIPSDMVEKFEVLNGEVVKQDRPKASAMPPLIKQQQQQQTLRTVPPQAPAVKSNIAQRPPPNIQQLQQRLQQHQQRVNNGAQPSRTAQNGVKGDQIPPFLANRVSQRQPIVSTNNASSYLDDTSMNRSTQPSTNLPRERQLSNTNRIPILPPAIHHVKKENNAPRPTVAPVLHSRRITTSASLAESIPVSPSTQEEDFSVGSSLHGTQSPKSTVKIIKSQPITQPTLLSQPMTQSSEFIVIDDEDSNDTFESDEQMLLSNVTPLKRKSDSSSANSSVLDLDEDVVKNLFSQDDSIFDTYDRPRKRARLMEEED
jgi:hypothetical protein